MKTCLYLWISLLLIGFSAVDDEKILLSHLNYLYNIKIKINSIRLYGSYLSNSYKFDKTFEGIFLAYQMMRFIRWDKVDGKFWKKQNTSTDWICQTEEIYEIFDLVSDLTWFLWQLLVYFSAKRILWLWHCYSYVKIKSKKKTNKQILNVQGFYSIYSLDECEQLFSRKNINISLLTSCVCKIKLFLCPFGKNFSCFFQVCILFEEAITNKVLHQWLISFIVENRWWNSL